VRIDALFPPQRETQALPAKCVEGSEGAYLKKDRSRQIRTAEEGGLPEV
jgi:hypothetical protein